MASKSRQRKCIASIANCNIFLIVLSSVADALVLWCKLIVYSDNLQRSNFAEPGLTLTNFGKNGWLDKIRK